MFDFDTWNLGTLTLYTIATGAFSWVVYDLWNALNGK